MTQGASTVTFNGTVAAVTSWSATSLATAVPAGATTGNVVVTVSGVASNGVNFTVTQPPTVAGVNPASGPVGGTVTTYGNELRNHTRNQHGQIQRNGGDGDQLERHEHCDNCPVRSDDGKCGGHGQRNGQQRCDVHRSAATHDR